MGCDIHLIAEYKSENQWRLNPCIEVVAEMAKDIWLSRSYRLFGAMAGVRAPDYLLYEPRGLPNDLTSLSKLLFDDCDFHTPSWLTWKEAMICAIYSKNSQFASWLLYAETDYIPRVHQRVVFAFDN